MTYDITADRRREDVATPLDDHAARQVAVIGARMIGNRQDFWIVTLTRYRPRPKTRQPPRLARENPLVSAPLSRTCPICPDPCYPHRTVSATPRKTPGHAPSKPHPSLNPARHRGHRNASLA